jgi:hypothetical protein
MSAEAVVDWFTGTGISYGSSYGSLDFGYFGGQEEAQLEVVLENDNFPTFNPAEVERFKLEIQEDRY